MKISFSSYSDHLEDLKQVLLIMNHRKECNDLQLQKFKNSVDNLLSFTKVMVHKHGKGYVEIDF